MDRKIFFKHIKYKKENRKMKTLIITVITLMSIGSFAGGSHRSPNQPCRMTHATHYTVEEHLNKTGEGLNTIFKQDAIDKYTKGFKKWEGTQWERTYGLKDLYRKVLVQVQLGLRQCNLFPPSFSIIVWGSQNETNMKDSAKLKFPSSRYDDIGFTESTNPNSVVFASKSKNVSITVEDRGDQMHISAVVGEDIITTNMFPIKSRLSWFLTPKSTL